MTQATFLALQGPTGKTADLAPLVTAAQAQNGRLCVLHVGPVPAMTYGVAASPYAIPVVPDAWITARNDMFKMLSTLQKTTQTYLQSEGLTGEVATICVEPAALHDQIAVRALFADVSVVQDSLRSDQSAFRNIVYGLLFEAPGPVILNAEQNSKAFDPENVLIAWNSSVPAARAVRAALPFLKTAKEVTVASFDADASPWGDGDNPGADLATWLAHHGCDVTVQEYATGRKSVSEAILERARERTADLVVMGAYGRSRWNERFFGGTTEEMLKQQKVPVFLAH